MWRLFASCYPAALSSCAVGGSGAGGAVYLTSNAGFTRVAFQGNAAPSGGAVGVGQSSSGIYFNGCTFSVSVWPAPAALFADPATLAGALLAAAARQLRGTRSCLPACWRGRWGLTTACAKGTARLCGYTAGGAGRRGAQLANGAPAPWPCLQGNSAEVFGNDVYMESWVATPAFFNPFPTSAGAHACARGLCGL